MSHTRQKPRTTLSTMSKKLLDNAATGRHIQNGNSEDWINKEEKKEEHQATNTLRRYAQVEQNKNVEDESIHARLLPNVVKNNESDEEEDKLETALLQTEEIGRATFASGFEKIAHNTPSDENVDTQLSNIERGADHFNNKKKSSPWYALFCCCYGTTHRKAALPASDLTTDAPRQK